MTVVGRAPTVEAQSQYCSLARPAVVNGDFEYPGGGAVRILLSDTRVQWTQDGTGGSALISLGWHASGYYHLRLTADDQPRSVYQDLDTVGGEVLNISFGVAAQYSLREVAELWAGPPNGPMTLVLSQQAASTRSYVTASGSYTVPSGQTTTRIRLTGRNGSSSGGGVLVDSVVAGPTAACDDVNVVVGAGASLDVPVLGNDLGVGIRLDSVGSPSPAGVSATKVGDSIRVVAPAGANADDVVIPYTIRDSASPTMSSSGSLHVRVAPAARPDAATVPAGATTPVDVLGNDVGSGLSVSAVSTPTHGTAVVNAGRVDYTPNPGYSGPDSFSYTLSGPGVPAGGVTATVSVTVQASADVAVAVGASTPVSPSSGQNFEVPVTVSNAGPNAAGSPVVTFPNLPAGVSFGGVDPNCVAGPPVRCTVPASNGGLASGGTYTFRPHFTSSSAGVKAFGVTVSATSSDPVAGNNSASATVTVVDSADMSVSGGAVSGTPVPGSPISWSVDVGNAGPGAAGASSVRLTWSPAADISGVSVTVGGSAVACTPAGAGAVDCPVAALASGASTQVVASGALDAANSVDLAFSATLTPSTADPDLSNDSTTWTTEVNPIADVSVTGSLVSALPLLPGATVDFRFTVANGGPSTAPGAFVKFALPAGLKITSAPAGCNVGAAEVRCALGDVAPGASVPPLDLQGVVLHFVTTNVDVKATADAYSLDTQAANNSATVAAPVTPQADVGVALTASPTAGGAGLGQTFTLDVTNVGPSDADNVVVSVAVPSELALGALPAGCTGAAPTVTCTFAAVAAQGQAGVQFSGTWDATAGVRNISATRTGSSPVDVNAGNDVANLAVTVNPVADLSVVGRVAPVPLVAGPATLSVDVSNAGPSAVTGATLTVALPAVSGGITVGAGLPAGCSGAGAGPITCSVDVAAGAMTSLVLPIDVAGAPSGAATFTATVTLPAGTVDPSTPNTATFDSSPPPRNDLEVSTGGNAEAIPGLLGTAVFVVTNNGPDDAPHSPMVIDLPAGRVGAPVIDGASCTPSTDPARPDQLICDAGPVRSLANDPNAFQLVTVSFVPPAGQTAPMSVDAYTSPDLTAFYVDKDLKNDVGAVQLRMTPETDMLLTGSAPASLAVGAAGDWQFQVSNPGPSDSAGATATFDLSAGLAFTGATGASCTASGAKVTCAIGPIAAGGSLPIVVQTTAADAQADYSVAASVTGQAAEVDPANNTITLTAAGPGAPTTTTTPPSTTTTPGGSTPTTTPGSGGAKLATTGNESAPLLAFALMALGLGAMALGSASLLRNRYRPRLSRHG